MNYKCKHNVYPLMCPWDVVTDVCWSTSHDSKLKMTFSKNEINTIVSHDIFKRDDVQIKM
jgi:hypothetical protein